MDPFSHALLGAASGQSLARAGRGMAALAAAAAALLPDADIFIASDSDPLLGIEYHRHFTHSLLAAPVGALIVAGVIRLALRRGLPFTALYWPALAGYLSAVLLDACTSYGTQLLWPFSNRRFGWNIIAVVDPVMTLVLLVGVVLAFRRGIAKPARIALFVAAIYLGCGWLQRERAEAAIEGIAAERGHAIGQHEVKPTLGNLLLWRSIYLTGNDYVIDAVRLGLLSGPLIYRGAVLRRITPLDLVPPLPADSVQAQDLVRFARLSEGFLARHPDRPDVIGDVRYAMLPNDTRPLWGIEIDPKRADRHVRFLTFREHGSPERQRFFAMLRGIELEPIPDAPARSRP